ncbi:MAG: ATP-binding cassette domain-containing protein [Rectinemataceae bacterium]
MIALESVVVSFPQGGGEERTVLRGLSFGVARGSTVSVIGSNGAGKSTLLNAIAGTVPLRSGTVRIDGADRSREPEWMRARYVGRVRQNPMAGSAGEMTVMDNLSMALRKGPRRLRLAVTPALARFLTERVAELGMGLETRMRENVSLLSGGQRQALTLLMAVLSKPAVLLLDEHTAALDPANAELVSALTKRFIAEYGLTALIVTHDMKRALSEADRIVMMHDGSIVADVEGAAKAGLGVEDLVRLFKRARGSEYAEDRDLLF